MIWYSMNWTYRRMQGAVGVTIYVNGIQVVHDNSYLLVVLEPQEVSVIIKTQQPVAHFDQQILACNFFG